MFLRLVPKPQSLKHLLRSNPARFLATSKPPSQIQGTSQTSKVKTKTKPKPKLIKKVSTTKLEIKQAPIKAAAPKIKKKSQPSLSTNVDLPPIHPPKLKKTKSKKKIKVKGFSQDLPPPLVKPKPKEPEPIQEEKECLKWKHLLQKFDQQPIQRKRTYIDLHSNPEPGLRFVSYNILADSIRESYEPEGVKVPPVMDYEQRNLSILRELELYQSDIICFQEMESGLYYNLFEPQLSKLGFEGYFSPKPNPVEGFKTTKFWRPRVEGLATFWKRSFTAKDKKSAELRQCIFSANPQRLGFDHPKFMKEFLDKRHIVSYVLLQDGEQQFVVANTHIYSFSARREIQISQAYCAIKAVETYLNGANVPVIFCGDFNSLPGSSVYQFFNKGSLFAANRDLTWLGKPIIKEDLRHDLELQSLYGSTKGEPVGTANHFDGHTYDYIWYSKKFFKPTKVLQLPPRDILKKIPNEQYPSDHVAISGEFAFLKNVPMGKVSMKTKSKASVSESSGRKGDREQQIVSPRDKRNKREMF